MTILKIYPLPFLIFSLLFSALSRGNEPDLEESAFLVKYKTPELQLRAIKKMESAKTFLADSKQKVEALTPEWVKISGDPQNLNRILQMQKKEIDYIQPDFKVNLIEDYQLKDPKERADYLIYLQQNQQLMARSKYSDNPKISEVLPQKTSPDPLLASQWGMLDMGGPQVWKQIQSIQSTQMNQHTPIIVAVIDTGVDYTHPDLSPNMWRNPGETGLDASGKNKSTNKIDDDGNGYIDDVVGYDFLSNDAFPYDLAVPSWQLLLGGGNPGHGTHCAGNIAARGNNGLGISGVAPNAQIMALRFIGNRGGSTSAAIKAIKYAVDNGAKILNNSWGSEGENPGEDSENKALKEAIAYAEAKGVLFIAAAGNGHAGKGYNNDTDSRPAYPASYKYSNIISVAAVNSENNLGSFSNWGKETVHIAAPGVKILSTIVGGNYADKVIPFLANWEGTSMAAPHVSGAAALYWSIHPEKTASEVKEAILASAVKIPSLENKIKSEGKLNLVNLMK